MTRTTTRSARTVGLLVGLAAAACGGAAAAPAPTKPAVEQPATPGAQCLAEANTERKAKTGGPEKVHVRHILVRHSDSRVKPEGITRTREEACLRALEALKKLQGGEEWNDVTAKYSDEKGATTNFGDLGRVRRDDVTPQFAETAFDLAPNQLSYVLETASGFHVILRVE